jgi:hypothetical protein
MSNGDLFAVIEHNQASGQPSEFAVAFRDDLAEAVELRDVLTAENRGNGRNETYLIYELAEVDEERLWVWGTRPAGTDSFPEWVSLYDRAHLVRRERPSDHEVVRRRVDRTDWEVVVCDLCKTAPPFAPCCYAHDKMLCHACYRRTHFVEVCGAGCDACAREGLPEALTWKETPQ